MTIHLKKKYLVFLVSMLVADLTFLGFSIGVFSGSEYPLSSTKLIYGTFSATRKSLTFNVNMSAGNYEHLHFKLWSNQLGSAFNVTLTGNPVYEWGPKAGQVDPVETVAYSWPEGRPEWSSFSYDFNLKLPHGGLWLFRIFAEGSGKLYVNVTLIEPGDPVGDLVTPAFAMCSFLTAAVLISMGVVLWRSGTADTVLKKVNLIIFCIFACFLVFTAILDLLG